MVRKLSLLGGVRYMSFDPHPREGAMPILSVVRIIDSVSIRAPVKGR